MGTFRNGTETGGKQRTGGNGKILENSIHNIWFLRSTISGSVRIENDY